MDQFERGGVGEGGRIEERRRRQRNYLMAGRFIARFSPYGEKERGERKDY